MLSRTLFRSGSMAIKNMARPMVSHRGISLLVNSQGLTEEQQMI